MDTIRIHGSDNVIVALKDLKAGTVIEDKDISITVNEDISRGHKIAIKDIKAGSTIVKYGCTIGTASIDISCGSHVHTHNVKTTLTGNGVYEYSPVTCVLPDIPVKSFMGYRRDKGRVGIRNEIWIIPTVGCVNSVAAQLAGENRDLVKGSVEGLYALSHPYGCSQMGEDHENTKKLLAALVHHPNAGGVLVLSLGCENLTVDQFKEELGEWKDDRVKFLTCQNVDDELKEGRRLLKELADNMSSMKRESIDASELTVGLKCGGSDGLSGITANPVVGACSDMLISMGGSAILTEVPEMFGAEGLLFNRCRDRATYEKAVKMVEDFKDYYTAHGQVVYENPSPGNKAGGITTLEDKSCGCVQKGGRAPVSDVISYAQQVKRRGLSLLSGPGNDIVSTTALTAAGAHMILFTTGRGTPLGSFVPTLKISTNTELYKKKNNWIDFNAGSVADGDSSIDEAAGELLELLLAVASGKKTKQEVGENREIAIFKDGVTL